MLAKKAGRANRTHLIASHEASMSCRNPNTAPAPSDYYCLIQVSQKHMMPRVNLLATATKYNHFTSNQRYEKSVFSISNSVFFSFHASQFHAFRSPYTLLYIHPIFTHIYIYTRIPSHLIVIGWLEYYGFTMCGGLCCFHVWRFHVLLLNNNSKIEP